MDKTLGPGGVRLEGFHCIPYQYTGTLGDARATSPSPKQQAEATYTSHSVYFIYAAGFVNT